MTDSIEQVAYDRRAEVEALLRLDDTAVGRIWRMQQDEGLSQAAIAEREGITPAPVYSALRTADMLLTGAVTSYPTVAAQHAGRIRSWFWDADRGLRSLSPELRRELEDQERALNAVTNDRLAQEREDESAADATRVAVSSGVPGIYVYTLPHYLRYPIDKDTGKTLLKVGHSSTDAFYRAGSQGRLTALPEDPILLRIYPTSDSAKVEREFHDWLGDADHARSDARRGGSEWFVTSTRFLDRIARSLSLDVQIVKNVEVGDE
jgi:hypothetical protein